MSIKSLIPFFTDTTVIVICLLRNAAGMIFLKMVTIFRKIMVMISGSVPVSSVPSTTPS